MADIRYADGGATIEPAGPVPARGKGQWTLRYRPEVEALPPGSAVRITVPPGFSPPQTENPDAPGFVRATCEDPAVALHVAVDGCAIEGFDPHTGRDVDPGVMIFVERAPLKPGAALLAHYEAHAGALAGAATFRVYVCTDGRAYPERFFPVDPPPALDVVPDAPDSLEALCPSGAEPGGSLPVRVAMRDAYGNRCSGWSGWLSVTSPTADLGTPAAERREDPGGDGVALSVGLPEDLAGVLRVRVSEAETGLTTECNPVLIGQAAPYWGDIHACVPETDAPGSGVDFELAVGEAPAPERIAFQFHAQAADAGEAAPGPLNVCVPDAESDEMLSAHLLEIYSCWGNREHWGARRTDVAPGRHPERTVHAVLSQGIIAGFAAGSNSRIGAGPDAPRSAPGRGYRAGLTGVYATALTQAAVFTALRERRCFATTGPRIVMRMDVAGHTMGQRVEASAGDRQVASERTVRVTVHGTSRVDRIEIVRNNVEVCTYRGDDADVAFTWTDRQDLRSIALRRAMGGGSLTCYYFARVTQEDGEIAWSSPVWFVLE